MINLDLSSCFISESVLFFNYFPEKQLFKKDLITVYPFINTIVKSAAQIPHNSAVMMNSGAGCLNSIKGLKKNHVCLFFPKEHDFVSYSKKEYTT